MKGFSREALICDRGDQSWSALTNGQYYVEAESSSVNADTANRSFRRCYVCCKHAVTRFRRTPD